MPANKSTLALVILAAGQAKRFGTPKQLATYQGKTLIGHAISLATTVANDNVWLVHGAHSAEILAQEDMSSVHMLFNPDWSMGMSTSIRAAVHKLGATHDALLFICADQVLITPADLQAMITHWKAQTHTMVCATFDGQLSIPALFPRWTYPELLTIEGDGGGKKLLLAHPEKLSTVEMINAKTDIDTPADLLKLQAKTSAGD